MKLRIMAGWLAMAFMSCSSGGSGGDDTPFYQVPRWVNLQRTPTFSDLRAVRFNTATQGFVAGRDASIYRTDDGGLTWVQSETVPAERGGHILGFDFLGFSVHAVGTDEAGTAGRFWTSDDGLNFTTADAPGSGSIFVSVDVVTNPDGGEPFVNWYLRENWDIRVSQGAGTQDVVTINPPMGSTAKAKAIDMLFDGRGVAVGEDGLIFETVDYWNNAQLRTGAGTSDLHDVQVAGPGVYFACGEAGTIVWTDEGGDMEPLLAPPTAATFRGVHFDHIDSTSSVGWAVGNGGVIFKFSGTFSAGAWTWSSQPQTSNTTEDLYDVHFVDRMNGYAVGNKGTVVRTTNGGTTWTVVTRGSVDTINAVCFEPTGVVGVAAGDAGKVYVTLNGGATWTENDLGTMTWTGVAIPPGNPNVAYVCGLNGQLRRNLDLSGGGSWDASTDGDLTGKNLRAILFPSSADVGFVVGDGSTLLYTNDGTTGFSWQAPGTTAPATDFKAICMGTQTVGGLTLIAAGNGGVIVEQSFSTYALPWVADGSAGKPAGDITAVQAGGVDFLVVATSGGVFRRLAGVWQAAATPPGPTPTGLAFPTSSLGWSVSDKIYTHENGANLAFPWTLSPAHTSSTLKAIWMNQTGTIGYAVGTNGLILKTISGGK